MTLSEALRLCDRNWMCAVWHGSQDSSTSFSKLQGHFGCSVNEAHFSFPNNANVFFIFFKTHLPLNFCASTPTVSHQTSLLFSFSSITNLAFDFMEETEVLTLLLTNQWPSLHRRCSLKILSQTFSFHSCVQLFLYPLEPTCSVAISNTPQSSAFPEWSFLGIKQPS